MVKLFPDGKTVGSNGSPAECSKPKDINKRWCCQSKTNKPNQPTKQPTKQKIPQKSNQILKRKTKSIFKSLSEANVTLCPEKHESERYFTNCRLASPTITVKIFLLRLEKSTAVLHWRNRKYFP